MESMTGGPADYSGASARSLRGWSLCAALGSTRHGLSCIAEKKSWLKCPMTQPRYTGTARALHWLAALLIFCGFGLGLFMTGLEITPDKLRYYGWHKWLGITVFLLAAARLAWRAVHPAPPLPAIVPAWQMRASHAAHAMLYVLMLAIPVSGWIYSSATGVSVVYLGLVPLPDLVPKDREAAKTLLLLHQSLNSLLAFVVSVHIAAALKHHFVDRDDVLVRMLPGR
jgi:cytochrome b561